MENYRSYLLRKEYISRINLVQDYIEKNINNVFQLEELAEISGFSKYHFHRIFKGIVNETLYNYINRLKLEKASSYLLYAPHKTITEIALKLGFNDSAMFARSFKNYYGLSATEYRKINSNKSKMKSKIRKASKSFLKYNEVVNKNDWRKSKMKNEYKVEVAKIEEMTVIYLRLKGENNTNIFQDMVRRLITYASAQGLINDGEIKLLSVYHDNPEITEVNKQRTSVCMAVPKDTKVDGEIGKMTISAGKYAIGHFVFDNDNAALEHRDAWQYLYGEWLPDDGVNFEIYLNDPNIHPEKKHFIDIYIPIKPL